MVWERKVTSRSHVPEVVKYWSYLGVVCVSILGRGDEVNSA